MTEYWVSNARYFCPRCHVWLTDNKISREHHERGKHHRDNVERYLYDIRKKSRMQEEESREKDDIMLSIERQAVMAYEKDIGVVSGTLTTPSMKRQSLAIADKKAEELRQDAVKKEFAKSLVRRKEAEEALKLAQSRGVIGSWTAISDSDNAAAAAGSAATDTTIQFTAAPTEAEKEEASWSRRFEEKTVKSMGKKVAGKSSSVVGFKKKANSGVSKAIRRKKPCINDDDDD